MKENSLDYFALLMKCDAAAAEINGLAGSTNPGTNSIITQNTYEIAPEVVDQMMATFQTSISKMKLHYPEPYLASASHMHTELHFLHILHYQFWLWYFFIFLVTFFFLSFIMTAKWNQPSVKPRRETRGVSRSKCGDLITATVPLTWAASIIVSESTDATDVTDGFSTGEVIIGVRAYQWGWEYYYPRTRTLRHSEDLTYSSLVGNSIKYTSSSANSRSSEPLWRQFQSKTQSPIITPAQIVATPELLANFKDFDNVGLDVSKQQGAFSKVTAKTKTSNSNLSYTHKSYVTAYKNVNNLLTLGEYSVESPLYGLKRQTSVTSLDSLLSNSSSFLDNVGKARFLESRSGAAVTTPTTLNKLVEVQTGVVLESEQLNHNLSTLSNYSNLLTNQNQTNHPASNKTSSSFVESISKCLGGDSSDRYPTASLLTGVVDKSLVYPFTTNTNSRAFNPSTPNTRSDDISFLQSEQSTRTYTGLGVSKSNVNLSGNHNPLTAYFTDQLNTPQASNLFTSTNANNFGEGAMYIKPRLKFDNSMSSNLLQKRSTLGFPRPPFMSNNLYLDGLDFDKTSSTYKTTLVTGPKTTSNVFTLENSDSIRVLQGDSSSSLAPIFGAYWRKFWANSGTKVRFAGIGRFVEDDSNFYLPNFTNYYDYDFRNAQSIELFEDAFWESCYSSYDHYDYINISRGFKRSEVSSKWSKVFDELFYAMNVAESNEHTSTKTIQTSSQFFSNPTEIGEGVNLPHVATLKNQNMFTVSDTITPSDDSTELVRDSRGGLENIFRANVTYSLPVNYKVVLNSFRNDLSDPIQLTDNVLLENDLFTSTNTLLNQYTNTRLANPLVLRSTARNSIVTFNALRKVFRSRFDEGRSHVTSDQFASLHTKQPFISGKGVNYRGILSKNTDSYYTTPLYTTQKSPTIQGASNLLTLQNFYFYDLPFLLSQGSDPQKFMWFDWWANWGVFEVQPSSVAKYSTLGVPYSRKHFDFSSDQADTIQDSETYINRIVRLRKNYLPNWQYTPILFNKLMVWNNPIKSSVVGSVDSYTFTHLRCMLRELNTHARAVSNNSLSLKPFTPSISGSNVFHKKSWRPFSSIQSYYYDNTHLVDVLTKRELLYRKYFYSKGKFVNLPSSILSTPKNPLLDEIKSSFALIDPSTYSMEVSRDYFYLMLPYFKYTVLKSAILDGSNVSELPINLNLLTNYLLLYFFNIDSTDLGSNQTLFKDQHRPLKKGITNMLRLHSTGAVTVPAHTRLQILASSRDVIHSWAIPSAGIKIDCVPGYTSHRIMTFNFEGVYWGQCQEICGRYHHWMPIVMYVLKRDIFILWCTHFVFKSSRLYDWKVSESEYVNYNRNASYDKNSWLNEAGFESLN